MESDFSQATNMHFVFTGDFYIFGKASTDYERVFVRRSKHLVITKLHKTFTYSVHRECQYFPLDYGLAKIALRALRTRERGEDLVLRGIFT